MLALLALTPTAFTAPSPLLAGGVRVAASTRAAVSMLDIPRVALPDAVSEAIKEQDLKSPNDLSDADYNTYSAAAIGGTLIFFILPLFDLLGFFGDFVFAALIGGGAAIYCSLRKDAVGEYANKFGGIVLQGADAVAEQVPKLVKQIKDKL
jgi:hypothetical protein